MDRDAVRRLAHIAHLPLAEGEAEALAADLAVILGRLEPLRRADVTAAPPLVALEGAAPRDDATAPDAMVRGPESFSPGFRAPYFVVPRLPSHADGTLSEAISADAVAADAVSGGGGSAGAISADGVASGGDASGSGAPGSVGRDVSDGGDERGGR